MAERSSDSHADTRLYLIVHNAFRLMTTRFVDATEKLEPAALQPMIRSRWNDYAALFPAVSFDEHDAASCNMRHEIDELMTINDQ